MLDLQRIEDDVSVNAIIVGITVGRVEIDKSRNLIGVAAADRTQFLACNRMAHQDRPSEVERIDNSQHVIAQTVRCIIAVCRSWFAGGAKASSCDAVDVMVRSKLRSELVENVGVVPKSCKKDQRSTGPTPVDNFQLDVLFDGDKLRCVWS